MDLKTQIIREYLAGGASYRQLSAKYGMSRDVINKRVTIHQAIHNLPATERQEKYSTSNITVQRKS
jgi:transposase-like protein